MTILGKILRDAVLHGNIDAIQNLAIDKAVVNELDDGGNYTALMLAARSGFVELVEAVLKKGANPNIANGGGFTPLMNAASNSFPEAVGVLLAGGANVNAVTKNNLTALKIASQNIKYSSDSEASKTLDEIVYNVALLQRNDGADFQTMLFGNEDKRILPLVRIDGALDSLSQKTVSLLAIILSNKGSMEQELLKEIIENFNQRNTTSFEEVFNKKIFLNSLVDELDSSPEKKEKFIFLEGLMSILLKKPKPAASLSSSATSLSEKEEELADLIDGISMITFSDGGSVAGGEIDPISDAFLGEGSVAGEELADLIDPISDAFLAGGSVARNKRKADALSPHPQLHPSSVGPLQAALNNGKKSR